MTIFSTLHFTVKQFTQADFEDFYALNSNAEVLRYIRPIKNKEACLTFLNEQLQDYIAEPTMGRWYVAEKDTNRLIGTFSILYMQGDVDYHIGYALMPSEWGKGFATELLTEGILYFFTNFSKSRLFAITQPENIASEKVLAKTGFRLCGSITNESGLLNLFAINRSIEDCPLTIVNH
jgi:[ribosomal protein S5]-alanine N-acetyltransferase